MCWVEMECEGFVLLSGRSCIIMSSLFDSYEKDFKRNQVTCNAHQLRAVCSHALVQLFMNERVDKLNSLTGSGLATCLQEAEESVLFSVPSTFPLLISLIVCPAESVLRHPRKNGLRGQLAVSNAAICNYEYSLFAVSYFVLGNIFAGAQFIRKWSGMRQ